MVRSDSEKAQTTLGYLVPLKATNEMNKCLLVYGVNSGGRGGEGSAEGENEEEKEVEEEQAEEVFFFFFTGCVTFKMLFISPQQGSC